MRTVVMVRRERALLEDEPELPGFVGARIAAERNDRSLDLRAGLAARERR